tara:strand:- start:2130 stop:2480 length:351 start_codon:yes stop_codon:yes gene_type:complete
MSNLFNSENSKTNPLYETVELDINDVKECRICLETSGELLSICGCNGSLKYVHKHCIEQWIRHNRNNKCELCNQEYNIQLNALEESTRCSQSMLFILYLLYIIMFAIIIILITKYM